MFNRKKIEIIEADINYLNREIVNIRRRLDPGTLEDKKFIGEYAHYDIYSEKLVRWAKFSRANVTEEINGHMKINEGWRKKSEVIFYDSVYEKQKEKIEEKVNAKNTNK